MTHEEYRSIILEWKHTWMKQKDNDYFHRAFSIDSNMIHDLARRLSEPKPKPAVKETET